MWEARGRVQAAPQEDRKLLRSGIACGTTIRHPLMTDPAVLTWLVGLLGLRRRM